MQTLMLHVRQRGLTLLPLRYAADNSNVSTTLRKHRLCASLF